jgi:tRNA nucleotidyltransferase (CCA-adding enzyme)
VQLLPEVDALFDRTPRGGGEAALEAGARCLQALDRAAAADEPLAIRYAVLAAGLGSVARATAMSSRLKVPVGCRDLAQLTARYAATVRRAAELTPAALLDLFAATDALRRPERLAGLVRASLAAREPDPAAAPGVRLAAALAVVRGVDAGALASRRPRADDLPRRIRAARLRALRDWMRAASTRQA